MRSSFIDSRRLRLTSWAAIISFTSAATGCVASEEPRPAESGSVTVDVRIPAAGGGWTDVLQEEVPEDELPTLGYEYQLADGRRTTDPSVALAAAGFSVEVAGGRVEFRRDGEVIELVAAPIGGTPSGAPPVRAVRLDGNRAAFHVGAGAWRARPADVEIAVSSATAALADRELRSLTMTLLLAPHQDRPQIAWFAVVAIVGVGWLAFCGGFLAGCSDACACYSGYKANCLGFTVSRIRGEWDVSFDGLGCTCVLPKIAGPGCNES